MADLLILLSRDTDGTLLAREHQQFYEDEPWPLLQPHMIKRSAPVRYLGKTRVMDVFEETVAGATFRFVRSDDLTE